MELDRRVEVRDGDADVVDPAEHRAQCTLTRSAHRPLGQHAASGGGLDPEPLAAPCARGARRSRCSAARPRSWSARRPARSASRWPAATARSAAAAELAGRLGVPLAVIPTGTANDFARAIMDLPEDPLEAAALAATGTEPGGSSSAGSPTGARSSTSPAPGLAAKAARRAAPLKPVLGPLAYGVGALAPPRRSRRCAAPSASTASPVRRRRLAADRRRPPARSAAARTSAPPTRATACSTWPSCPPARGSGSPAAPGGCAGTIAEQRAGRAPARHGARDRAAAPAEFNVDGEIRDGGLERVTVERDAYALVVLLPPGRAIGPSVGSVPSGSAPPRRPAGPGRATRAGSAARPP